MKSDGSDRFNGTCPRADKLIFEVVLSTIATSFFPYFLIPHLFTPSPSHLPILPLHLLPIHSLIFLPPYLTPHILTFFTSLPLPSRLPIHSPLNLPTSFPHFPTSSLSSLSHPFTPLSYIQSIPCRFAIYSLLPT